MITFLALNTSGLTLIPTTVIAIRMQYKSVAPTEIVGTTIITTVITTMSAIILDRILYNLDKNKRGKRSEEHTSELQSRGHLVCRLLLEKTKNRAHTTITR